MTNEEHVENQGQLCPHCDDSMIEGDDIVVEDGKVYQDMYCLVCESGWTDIYELKGFSNLIAGDE